MRGRHGSGAGAGGGRRPNAIPLVLLTCALCTVQACGGCGSSIELSVTLTTDFRAPLQFTSVTTTMTPAAGGAGRSVSLDEGSGAGTILGQHVADFASVASGTYRIEVTLLDAAGHAVATGTRRSTVTRSGVVAVVIQAPCASVTCPGPGDGSGDTVCYITPSGTAQCAPPGCPAAGPVVCHFAACTADPDCDSAALPACEMPSCIDGLCVGIPDDSRCSNPVTEECSPSGCVPRPTDAGTPDAGTPDAGTPDAGPVARDAGRDACVCGAHQHCGAAGCVCDSGWADCDGLASTGCEADLTSAAHCGTCTRRCSGATSNCDTSTTPATCTSSCGSLTDCSGSCVDTTNNHTNCGGCGHVCPSAEVCQGSRCVCSTMGDTLCGTACTDTSTDPRNCGSCGNSCGPDETCSGGTCHCGTGGPCAVPRCCAGTCFDTSSDSSHCGTCVNACAAGDVCSAGTCISCGSAGGSCCPGGTCVSGLVCTSGTCMCSGGLTLCGSTCKNTSTDNANCGSCGHACASGRVCSGGACACASGTMNCSGTCVDTSTNDSNCGSCGHACTGGMMCSGGSCVCPSGFTNCSGTCIDLTRADTNNCGGCGVMCAATEFCCDTTSPFRCISISTPSLCP